MLALLMLTSLLYVGCSDEKTSSLSQRAAHLTGGAPAALTLENARVFGFESAADWSNVSTTSATHSQGAFSAAVNVNSWTEVQSIPLSSPGGVASQMSVDVLIPEQISWGSVKLIAKIPSAGLHYLEVGSVDISALPLNSFNTLEFTLPANLVAALNGTYSDLQFTIVFNAPPTSAPYLLDNLQILSDGSNPDTGVDTSTDTDTATDSVVSGTFKTFTFQTPKSVRRDRVMISATERLDVNDRVLLGHANDGIVEVCSFDGGGTQFDAGLFAWANLISTGDVVLNADTKVVGFVKTNGTVSQQASATVYGGIIDGASLAPDTRTFSVLFPNVHRGDRTLERGRNLWLFPGDSYNQMVIREGASIVLSRAGNYFFNELHADPGSKIYVKTLGGPVNIYVRNILEYKGKIVVYSGSPGAVMFGYLGTAPAYIKGPMTGSIIAPNGKIELRRPETGYHRGQFFGKEIEIYTDVPVRLLSYPWDDTIMDDEDGDGVPYDSDDCNRDPNKSEAGICGCNVPDDDRDSDGMPDCEDECPDDPNHVTLGDCGCIGIGDGLAVGSTCDDAACPGLGVCDENGVCQVEEDCAPEEGCVAKMDGEHTYWICGGTTGTPVLPGSMDDAAAKCDNGRGRGLLTPGTYKDNHFLNVSLQNEGVTVPVWIGANDIASDGAWVWSDKGESTGIPFWEGGAAGQSVRGKYSAWLNGQSPGGGASENCAVAVVNPAGGGTVWDDVSCSESHVYVCEEYKRHIGGEELNGGDVGMDDIWDAFEGLDGGGLDEPRFVDPNDTDIDTETDTRPIYDDDCVQGTDSGMFGSWDEDDSQVAIDFIKLCEKCQDDVHNSDPNADINTIRTACAGVCTGMVSIPDDNATCLFDDEPITWIIENDTDTAHTNFELLNSHKCRIAVEYQDAECNADLECVPLPGKPAVPENVVCGISVAPPNCPLDESAAVTRDCTGRGANGSPATDRASIGNIRCGWTDTDTTREPNCLEYDATELCEGVKICSGDEADNGNIDPTQDPGSYLTDTEWDSEKDFPQDTSLDDDTDTAYPDDPPCDDAGWDCANVGTAHKWCHFKTQPLAQQDPDGTRNGKSGSKVSFNFDPSFELKYTAEPRIMNVTDFELSAAAEFIAQVKFNLSKARGTLDLVKVQGSAAADTCGFETKASIEVMGMDFIDLWMDDEKQERMLGRFPKIAEGETDVTQVCRDTLANFDAAVDRAKKAMKDAQELIRQQKNALEDASGYPKQMSAELCNQVLAEGVPEGFADDLSCETATTEDVIQAFINHYNKQVKEITTWRNNYTDAISDLANKLTAEAGDTKTSWTKDLNIAAVEINEDIVSVQFFIGPLPCLLEVGAYISYGVAGGLGFHLLNLGDGAANGDIELASASADITPYAGAGITLYVGVGFKINGFKASAGIEGAINLANVDVPFVLKAGLNLATSEDHRIPTIEGIPTSLHETIGSKLKKYHLSMNYTFYAGVVIQNILSGEIRVKIKLKFFFFSKTYRKTILKFKSPIPRIDIPIFELSNGGSIEGYKIAHATMPEGSGEKAIPWGEMETPTALMDLGQFYDEFKASPVYTDANQAWKDAKEDIQAYEDLMEAISNGQQVAQEEIDEVTAAKDVAEQYMGEADFDSKAVGSMFYDEQCAICVDKGKDCVPETERGPKDSVCCPGYECLPSYWNGGDLLLASIVYKCQAPEQDTETEELPVDSEIDTDTQVIIIVE